jgi:transposase
MYRLQISEEAFLETVMLHYGGYSSRRIARDVGISKSTALRVLERAAEYADQVKLALVRTGRAPQDVAERLAELIRWRSAARAGNGRSAKRGSRRSGLRGVAGGWSGEDHGAILAHIYRLRERQGTGG